MHSHFSNRSQFADHSKHKTTIKKMQQQSKAIETNQQKIKNNQTQSKTKNQNNQTKSKTIKHNQNQSTKIQKQSFAINQTSKNKQPKKSTYKSIMIFRKNQSTKTSKTIKKTSKKPRKKIANQTPNQTSTLPYQTTARPRITAPPPGGGETNKTHQVEGW